MSTSPPPLRGLWAHCQIDGKVAQHAVILNSSQSFELLTHQKLEPGTRVRAAVGLPHIGEARVCSLSGLVQGVVEAAGSKQSASSGGSAGFEGSEGSERTGRFEGSAGSEGSESSEGSAGLKGSETSEGSKRSKGAVASEGSERAKGSLSSVRSEEADHPENSASDDPAALKTVRIQLDEDTEAADLSLLKDFLRLWSTPEGLAGADEGLPARVDADSTG